VYRPSPGGRWLVYFDLARTTYCLYVTSKQRLRSLAPGLTSRAVIEKMTAIQMIDVNHPAYASFDGFGHRLGFKVGSKRQQAAAQSRFAATAGSGSGFASVVVT
jgi:hypothetical protein